MTVIPTCIHSIIYFCVINDAMHTKASKRNEKLIYQPISQLTNMKNFEVVVNSKCKDQLISKSVSNHEYTVANIYLILRYCINYILRADGWCNICIDMKEGNTPLHILDKFETYIQSVLIKRNLIEIMRTSR